MKHATLLPVLAATVLLSAACQPAVSHADGQAAPVTASPVPSASPTPSSPPSSTRTIEPSTRTTEPSKQPTKPASSKPGTAAPAAKTLGPNGLGPLKLGMTSKQATATGMITKWEGTEEAKCSLYSSLKGYPDARVAAGSTQGVQVIDGRPGLRTPEGIGIGSSESAVRDAYSGWKVAAADDPVGDHRGFVKVPGNADAYYRMMIKNKKVSELALESADQSCYE